MMPTDEARRAGAYAALRAAARCRAIYYFFSPPLIFMLDCCWHATCADASAAAASLIFFDTAMLPRWVAFAALLPLPHSAPITLSLLLSLYCHAVAVV